MNIRYVARSVFESNPSHMFFGKGTVSSFGIGLSTTSHAGTFTNTGKNDAVGPIFVVAALTSKLATSVSRFDKFANDDDIPVNCFFFIPSVATATWYMSSSDSAIWASLPKFTLKAGKSYKGYYVPLSALPPFGSRAEVGSVTTDKVTVRIKDYFLASATYFDNTLTKYGDRINAGNKIIGINGGDTVNYTKDSISVRNANVGITFSDILYDAVYDGTPSMTVSVSGVESESQDGYEYFRPIIKLNTNEVGHPKFGISEKNGDTAGRHGLDTIGNSGFTNNSNIPLDAFLTRRRIPTNTRSVNVGRKAKTVAGVDYMSGGYRRVNVYLAK